MFGCPIYSVSLGLNVPFQCLSSPSCGCAVPWHSQFKFIETTTASCISLILELHWRCIVYSCYMLLLAFWREAVFPSAYWSNLLPIFSVFISLWTLSDPGALQNMKFTRTSHVLSVSLDISRTNRNIIGYVHKMGVYPSTRKNCHPHRNSLNPWWSWAFWALKTQQPSALGPWRCQRRGTAQQHLRLHRPRFESRVRPTGHGKER